MTTIKNLLERGVEQIIDRENLKRRLLAGEKLRIKHGIDPTGPRIHLGRAVQFRKLKEFQDLGHRIVLIIGDFTAQIGDASDKQSMRRPLSEKEIKRNMANYTNQIGKILDLKKTEVHYNSKWLKKINLKDLINLAMKFTAQQMINRRNFKERWEKNKEIGLHELLYPLCQGYDSVAIKADVEVGGTDQTFNLIAGRKIQEIFGQKPQDLVISKMLEGLDGEKMSTSQGNVINITDNTNEMFGKIMSMHDEMILKYFELCTNVPMKEILEMEKQMKTGANPRNFKARLAFEITKIYHGEKAAQKAWREFDRIFRDKKIPSKIRTRNLRSGTWNIIDLIVESKLAPSKSEARRLIQQGAVKINNAIEKDWQKEINIKGDLLIQVGKHRFAKIIEK